MSLSAKAYSDLVEVLYSSTLDESQWRAFLLQLCEATDSVIAFLIRNDRTMGRCVLASSCAPVLDIGLSYTTADPVREAFMRSPRTGIVEVEDFLPHADLIQSDFYPLMAAQGAVYGTCIVPELSLRRYDLLAIWRSSHPRLEPHHANLLSLLFPHIQNALRISAALGYAERRAASTQAVLDASAAASILVDHSGHILSMNGTARQLVAAEDGLSSHGGRLTPTQPARRPEFSRLLKAAASVDPFPGGAMMLERASGKRALQLLVSQLRTEDASGRPRALLLITDPECVPQFPDRVLRELYDLTPAETEVANGLLTGYSPEAIASIRGVSVGTVRTQVKSLLSKTGTQRQMDLVRLLCALPVPPSAPVRPAGGSARAYPK